MTREDGPPRLVAPERTTHDPPPQRRTKKRRGKKRGLGQRRPLRGPLSSLARRIVLFNLLALVSLVAGVFTVNSFRDDLIEARVRALKTEGEIIAGAVGQAATRPEASVIEYRAARNILRRLAVPTGTRARIFDRDGLLLADTRQHLYAGQVETYPLEEPSGFGQIGRDAADWLWEKIDALLVEQSSYPLYTERLDQEAQDYAEVIDSLESGAPASAVRKNSDGALIVSVAVPVTRFKVVLGSLMLSTEAGDIDRLARQEAMQIFGVFLVALLVSFASSVFLASTIAAPVRKLAEAADRVRRVVGGRVEIPDFSARRDEIGDLSQSLRDMTDALYNRIDAIESFAADVAHEIKNPLTSLKSAVDTLPLVKTDEQRDRLVAVILHDIKRLDRLISDISNASRLDAELARETMERVDFAALLETLVDVERTVAGAEAPTLDLELHDRRKLEVSGLESRLGQVVQNLLSNAVSFSKHGDTITITARRRGDRVILTIDDEGPGIVNEQFEKIFDRFFTERPDIENFGSNSGLGLSISKQIVEAHRGTIMAENRKNRAGEIIGARFTVNLPAWEDE